MLEFWAPMSALGQKRKGSTEHLTSAFHPIADLIVDIMEGPSCANNRLHLSH